MPLLDHSRPPAEDLAPLTSVCHVWSANLQRWLNRNRPADHFRALCSGGTNLEMEALIVDCPLVVGPDAADPHAPPPASAFEVANLGAFTVRVHDDRFERKTVAAVEFLGPWVKECPRKRTRFLAKCLGYLSDGVGLVVVDLDTGRPANLHNELMGLLGSPPSAHLPVGTAYVGGYRSTPDFDRFRLDVWPSAVRAGQPLPTVPLALTGGPVWMLDLETTYMQCLADLNL